MGLSFGYGPAASREDGLAIIRAACEEGVTFFDGITTGRRPDEFLFIRDDGVPWGTHDHHRPMAAAVIAAV